MKYLQIRPGRAGVVATLAIGLVGSLLFLHSTSRAEDAKKIVWREDLGQAQAEAVSRDLLLWIQFTGPWCINCRRMERSTFVHPGVITQSRDSFIPVKLRSDEHEALAMSLGLSSLPSSVIVRPNGEVVEKYEGYIEPETFEVTLAGILTREGRSPEQLARAKKLKDSLALAGYCPVSLLNENKLIPGKLELALEHEGRIFRFASEQNRLEFRKKPDSFAPANDGHCPVSQVEKGDLHHGDPHWGVVYGGHLFLFKDGTQRDLFVKEPERYTRLDRTDRYNCAHCWNRSSLARQTPSRFTPSYQIEGLVSPSPDRLEALLAPTTTIRR
jgi:YHS domain-containing protein/thioredoxin-related protein